MDCLRNLCAVAAALALLAPAALASHTTNYATNPVEHDDQGRSNEPDLAAAGLYGGGLRDCTVDLDGDGRCTAADLAAWPAGQVAAPGCSDDAGRLPSGLCGLRTVGLGTGLTGPVVPPGLLGAGPAGGLPCALAAGQRPLRLLDLRTVSFASIGVTGGHPIFEVNRKLQDAGVFEAERRLLGEGSDVLPGPGYQVLAWYGIYHDKNCNGVIDHSGGAQADRHNEFTWISDTCRPYTGGPRVAHPDVCAVEPTEFLGWQVPGNHHAFFGGVGCVVLTCPFLPADLPGRLVLCTVLGGAPQECDEQEAELYGDPLFGPQGSNAPDWWFFDYTGDLDVKTRTYVAAYNWPMFHYDPSIVVTNTIFGAVNPVRQAEGVYDLGQAAFVDVDVLKSRSPALEAYVQALVKPTLRGAWLTLRGAL